MYNYLELSLVSGNDGIYVFAMVFVLLMFIWICSEAYSRIYGRGSHRHHRHHSSYRTYGYSFEKNER